MERGISHDVVAAAVRAVDDVHGSLHGTPDEKRYPIVSIADVHTHTGMLAATVNDGIALLLEHGQEKDGIHTIEPVVIDDTAIRTVQLSGDLPPSEPPVGAFSFQVQTSVVPEGGETRSTQVSVLGEITPDGAVVLNPESMALYSEGVGIRNGVAKVPRHGPNIRDIVAFTKAALPQKS